MKVQIDGSQFQGTDADRLKVSVRGTNPGAESLLTYLSRGAFEAARTVGGAVLDDAEMNLQRKGKDPSAPPSADTSSSAPSNSTASTTGRATWPNGSPGSPTAA